MKDLNRADPTLLDTFSLSSSHSYPARATAAADQLIADLTLVLSRRPDRSAMRFDPPHRIMGLLLTYSQTIGSNTEIPAVRTSIFLSASYWLV